MKLTKLEMIRFGKFRDHTLTLSDGLTLLRQDNESGKTTTADFIRFMFYGLPYRGRKNLSLGEDLLEKYQPWDSEEGLCGALELMDQEGRFYRLERVQNRKGKGRVRLLDADGGVTETETVGQELLGLDEQTFINVFYVRAGGQSFQRTEQMEIAMRNLVTTGDEAVGFDTVMDRLARERANYISPKGSGGKLKQIENEIEQLRLQVAMEGHRLEALAAENALAVDQAELSLQKQTFEAHREELIAFEKYERYTKYLELCGMREQLTALLSQSAGVLSETDKKALQDGFAARESGQILLRQAESEAAAAEAGRIELTAEEQALTNFASHTRVSGKTVAGIVVGILLTLGGIVAGMFSIPFFALAVVGALLTGISLFGLRLPRSLRDQGIRTRTALAGALARVEEKRRMAEGTLAVAENARRILELRQRQVDENEALLRPLCEKTGISDRQTLEMILQAGMQAELTRQRLQDIENRLTELGAVEPCEKAPVPTLSRTELAAEEETLKQRFALLQEQQVAMAGRRARLEADKVALEEKSALLENKISQRDAMARASRVVTLAIEQMNAAQAKLRENYAPRLRQAMGEKLAFLTDGKYDAVMLDEELSVRIKADGGMRELAYFSSGTADAAMLALRLSLAEILEGDKRLPMIFDDPFLHLDANRLARLRAYLDKAGAERQILLFSCKEFS